MQPEQQPKPLDPTTTPPAAPTPPRVASQAVAYDSNPFTASVSGLITILKVNPVAALLSSIFPIIPIALLVIVFLILAAISRPLGNIVILLGYIFLLPLISGASTLLATRSLEGRTTGIVQLYKDTLPKLLPLIGATILMFLAISLGLLLLVVPGVILAAWFALTYFVIFDENLGPVAAMKRSRELVKGHVWEVLGAYFAGFLIGGNGLLGTATGVAPMSARYQQLKALKASGQAGPKVHWLNFIGLIFLAVYIAFVTTVIIVTIRGIQDKVDTTKSTTTTNPYEFLDNSDTSPSDYYYETQ